VLVLSVLSSGFKYDFWPRLKAHVKAIGDGESSSCFKKFPPFLAFIHSPSIFVSSTASYCGRGCDILKMVKESCPARRIEVIFAFFEVIDQSWWAFNLTTTHKCRYQSPHSHLSHQLGGQYRHCIFTLSGFILNTGTPDLVSLRSPRADSAALRASDITMHWRSRYDSKIVPTGGYMTSSFPISQIEKNIGATVA